MFSSETKSKSSSLVKKPFTLTLKQSKRKLIHRKKSQKSLSNRFFKCFYVFLNSLLMTLKNLLIPPPPLKTHQITHHHAFLITKNTFASLFRRIITIQKFINKLKIRAGLHEFTNKQLSLIHDLSYPIIKKSSASRKALLKNFSGKIFKNRAIRRSIHIFRDFFKKRIKKHFDFLLKALKLFEKIPVLMPDRKLKVIWDLLIILIISASFYIIPMQLSFDIFYDDELLEVFAEKQISAFWGKTIIVIPELMLIFDTLLKFITGFYSNGIIIVEKSHIIDHYLKKGFIWDLLSYFPVLMQGILRKHIQAYGNFDFSIKLLQMLMFCKVKRVSIAISNFEAIIASNGRKDFVLAAVRMTYVLLFITHLNACAWYAVAYFNPDNTANTWLDESGLKPEYWIIKYFYSYYYATSMMVTVGYNKISPQNSMECCLGVILLVVSMMLFGYTINTMKRILDFMSKSKDEYKLKKKIFNIYHHIFSI